jgi:NADPH:quinone reductase and related Zn-dependent oxidoreductases
MKAILVRQNGGPEQLRYENTEQPKAGSGQVLVKVAAAGVNFIDVYQRSGLYKVRFRLRRDRRARVSSSRSARA